MLSTWKLGVRARLLLAFFAISAFAVLAAAAGIYAFREVGQRLEMVDMRVPPTLTSLELSRSTERIIGAAPALLAATDRQRRDEVKAQLGAEVERLKGRLLDLKRDRTEALSLLKIEPIVSSLTANLAALEDLVARRLDANERIKTLRRTVFQTNDETQRLFAPWLEVMDSQIAALVEGARKSGANDGGEAAQRLASLMELRRPPETAQRQFSATADMLVEASTTDQARRLSVLAFQLGRALRDLEATATQLDPKLRPLFLEQVAKLRGFVEGPNAIAEARRQELALIGEGERRLNENASLSAQLTAAADQLAAEAKRDIGEATRDALSVQRLSTRILVAVVALSLLTSALIVWLYVGRNIVRRLTTLSDGMLAIAGGKLHAAVAAQGSDEIAAMGQAVEIFRRNTLERDELLTEKAQAAERLEKEVKQRTAELTETLEQQTATSEVLQVISSSPTDIQPVLEAVGENAARLCDANNAVIFRLDGGVLRQVASYGGVPTASHPAEGLPVNRDRVTGRAVSDRRTIHVHDLAAAESDFPEGSRDARRDGHRTTLATPLLREGVPLGAILIRRMEVRPFSDRQIKLLETFADQAAIAINNVGLFEEVRARTQDLSRSVAELKALGAVGQAVSSSLELKVVLARILEHACVMSDAGGGAIYVYDKARGQFDLKAGHNMSEELIAAVRQHPIRLGESAVGQCAERRGAVQIQDLTEAPQHPLYEIHLKATVRALLAVPLLHQDEVIGALVVRREHAGVFTAETVGLLQSFADQSAIALENARLFEEIAQKSRQLEVASQHKSQFVANMSHELRTPLAAILGYAELMQEGIYGALPEKSKTALTRVRSNGKHLLGLINSVLDIAKIESGQFTLNLGEYALDTIVETVRVATESLAENKKLALKTDVAKRLPRGLGDEQRLTQVLLNLVGNAIKFTDSGEVRITATAVDGHFTVGVTDTGPGIPREEQVRIFEEFHQVDSSNTKTKGGTGLGLAIAKQIVEMHGGRIWVESTLGRGATFHMELPVRAATVKGAA